MSRKVKKLIVLNEEITKLLATIKKREVASPYLVTYLMQLNNEMTVIIDEFVRDNGRKE